MGKDVLRLARNFGLPHLHEIAARWLTKGLTTQNVVQRLVTCEEFGLGLLREKIIEQLTANPAELTVVSSSDEIRQHPQILQDLLMQVAMLVGMGSRKSNTTVTEKTKKTEKAEKVEKNEKVVEEQPAAPTPEELPEKTKKSEKPAIEKPAAKRQKKGSAGA